MNKKNYTVCLFKRHSWHRRIFQNNLTHKYVSRTKINKRTLFIRHQNCTERSRVNKYEHCIRSLCRCFCFSNENWARWLNYDGLLKNCSNIKNKHKSSWRQRKWKWVLDMGVYMQTLLSGRVSSCRRVQIRYKTLSQKISRYSYLME